MSETLMEHILDELRSIKKGLPNGELKSLASDVKVLKEDMSELRKILLNPENGIVVKTNKNSESIIRSDQEYIEIRKQLQEVVSLQRWRDGVNKALWILFAAIVGIVLTLLVNVPQV